MIEFQVKLIELLHKNVQIEREDIFSFKSVNCMPIHLTEDAKIMFPGYFGQNFNIGGIIVFGVNPGGGSDKRNVRHQSDHILYPLLANFKKIDNNKVETYQNINIEFPEILKSWNLWRIFEPTLQALDNNLTDIAYFNAIPYRTREDKKPPIIAQINSFNLLINPLLDLIQPSKIICLGKKAGEILNRFTENIEIITIPRTIGDSYISQDAKEIIKKIEFNKLINTK